jgi:type II secretory pathway pseudopilin PulG
MLGSTPKQEGAGVAAVLFAAFGLVAVVQIATGVGLLRLDPWARMLQIGLAALGLLGIPCGTIISILILVYMLKPEVKTLFSGISPQRLPPADVARVESLSQGSTATVVIIGVVLIFAAVIFVGIVAAIAIPSLLRARVSANESGAIGDLRTAVSAEVAYASANMGYGDRLECLAQPTQCIPGYPATGPVFLDPTFLTSPRHGYEFRFVPGPPAPPTALQSGQASPTSLTGWAYVAVPVKAGQTGIRSFCADMSGVICYRADGNPPDASAGACPVSDGRTGGGCTPL